MCKIYFKIVKQKNIGIAKALRAKHQQLCNLIGITVKATLENLTRGKEMGRKILKESEFRC